MAKTENILISILGLLNIRYTNEYANALFNEHPHHHNLYGLSDMLHAYNVENTGVQLTNTKDNFNEIQKPFIAHLDTGFVAVEKVLEEQVYYRIDGVKKVVPIDEFVNSWSGYALVPTINERSSEPNYKQHLAKKIIQFSFGGFCLIAFSFIYIYNTLYTHLLFNIILCCNIIGCYVGYLLLLKQMNINSFVGDKICKVLSKSDCGNILNSEAAKLMGIIGWSEIGFGYFFTNLLLMVISPGLTLSLLFIHAFSLPFTLWSLWYQRFKAKQWCSLCLLVLLILWIIFIISISGGMLNIANFSFTEILLIALIYATIILGIHLVIDKFSLAARVSSYKRNINKIKAVDEVFYSLLKNEPYFEVEGISNIIWGNPFGEIKLSVITNPHCRPCAKMHEEIGKLLLKSDRISVQYVFTSFKEHEVSSYGLIAAYAQLKDSEKVKSFFDEWFNTGKQNPEAFFEFHQIDYKNASAIHAFVKQYTWIKQNDLKATPTILVNGYTLPSIYNVKDIGYIL